LLLRQLFARQVARRRRFAQLRADRFDFLAAPRALQVGEPGMRVVQAFLRFLPRRLLVFLFQHEQRRAGVDLRAAFDEAPFQPSGRRCGDHHVFTLDVPLPTLRRLGAATGKKCRKCKRPSRGMRRQGHISRKSRKSTQRMQKELRNFS
jgi:hypothetical protein